MRITQRMRISSSVTEGGVCLLVLNWLSFFKLLDNELCALKVSR